MPKQKLTRRPDGRYQKRITLSNGKTRLVYGRTEAELKAAVRSVQVQDEAGLEVGDHTRGGRVGKKSGCALTSRGCGRPPPKCTGMPTICTSCSTLDAWSCRRCGRYIVRAIMGGDYGSRSESRAAQGC